jgi:hypothetical protein
MPLIITKEEVAHIINKIVFFIDYEDYVYYERGLVLEVTFIFNNAYIEENIENIFGVNKIKLVMKNFNLQTITPNYDIDTLLDSEYYNTIFNTIIKDYYSSLTQMMDVIAIQKNELVMVELPNTYKKIKLNSYENNTLLRCLTKENDIKKLIHLNIINDVEEIYKHFTIIDDTSSLINNKLIPLELSNYKLNVKKNDDTHILYACNIVIINEYSILEWEQLFKTHTHIKGQIISNSTRLLKELDNLKKYNVVCITDTLYDLFYFESFTKKYNYYRLFFENAILYNIHVVYLPNIVYKVYFITNNILNFTFFPSLYNYNNNILKETLNLYDNIYPGSFIVKIVKFYSDLYNNLIRNYIIHNNGDITNNLIELLSKNIFIYKVSCGFTKYNSNSLTTKHIPELTHFSIEDYKFNYIEETKTYNNNIKLFYLKINKSNTNINNEILNILYENSLFFEILHVNKDFKQMRTETKKKCETDENIKEKIEDSCIICYKDEKDELTLTNCCKSVICLSCAINVKIRNNKCPYCRNPEFKLNIIDIKLNQHTMILHDHKDLAVNCKLFKKDFMLNKILNYINYKNGFSKIVILNIGGEQRENYLIKNILKCKHINICEMDHYYVNKMKAFIREFNSIGGAVIINNLYVFRLFRYFAPVLDIEYVINYNYKSININNIIPFDIKKLFIKNKNVVIYDLVGSFDNVFKLYS